MGEKEMDAIRRNLRLEICEYVRIDFVGAPSFVCANCDSDAFMIWRKDKGWWECPECGFEMTRTEAWDLLQDHREKLRLMSRALCKEEGGGKRWLGWLRFFRRRRSPRASAPSSNGNSDERNPSRH